MREVIVYKWDNSLLKLKLSSVFHRSTFSVGFGGKARRSRVSYFFMSKLGVLFVFCLFISFLLCLQYWSNFLKKDTQEKSVLLANDGRVKYHRSKWSTSLSLSSLSFVVIIRDYSSSMSRTTDGNKDSSIYAFFLLLFSSKPNGLQSTRTHNHLNI